MFFDHITRQSFEYANQIQCEKTLKMLSHLIPILIKTLFQLHNSQKQTHLFFLNPLKTKLLLALTTLLLKMQVFTPTKISITFGIVC